MKKYIENLSLEKIQPYFSITSERTQLSENIIEKDFWVSWTLNQLFSIPFLKDQIIFKGGTSLSKVFKIIDRFSEDIDISISKEILGFSGDKNPEIVASQKQRTISISELADSCKSYVQTNIKNELQTIFESKLSTSNRWSIEVDAHDPDQQTLLFKYPSLNNTLNQYVKPMIKIEFGARSDHWPAADFIIQSMIEENFPESFEANPAFVKVLSIDRTFWEKATILHAYHHYPEGKIPASRQSRHYYDFYKILKSSYKDEAITNLALLNRVVEHKNIYFRAKWAKYNEAKKGTLKLIPTAEVASIIKRDYLLMQEMIYGNPPLWDEIIEEITLFEKDFNS